MVTPPEMNSSDALGSPDEFSLNLSLTQPPEKSSHAESPVVQRSADDDFVPKMEIPEPQETKLGSPLGYLMNSRKRKENEVSYDDEFQIRGRTQWLPLLLLG